MVRVFHCPDARHLTTSFLLAVALVRVPAQAELFSYATGVKDVQGISEEKAAVALGPPDYLYADGSFEEDSAATFTFPAPLDDRSGDDLIISIFVIAAGSDSTEVLVEARAAPNDSFVEIGTIVTADARMAVRTNPFAGFDHVHHFGLDFDGRVRKVTEVRLTNVSGSDLKLDALEGIHPAIETPEHAVEIRIFRLRDDFSKRFALRLKNIGPLGTGVALSGFSIEHATEALIDQTDKSLEASNGSFVATPETTAGPDNGPTTRRTDYVWSGAGDGLLPGDVASHQRFDTIDTDVPDEEFLENFTFTVAFADGTSLAADWNDIITEGRSGQLFSLYQYPPSPVSISEARPAFFFEFASENIVPEPTCTTCGEPPDDQDNSGDGVGNDNGNGGQVEPPMPVRCGPGAMSCLAMSFAMLLVVRLISRRSL